MKVLITGVAGFLGSHLADALLASKSEVLSFGKHEVLGVDNLLGGYLDNVPAGVRFWQTDCTSFEAMSNAMKGVDLVYHCAATAYEGLSVFSPSLVSRNIVDASVTVFSAAIANKVKRIVHCSSMARYGALIPPFKENQTCRPQDPYGIAKLAAEDMLKNLCTTHDVEYAIAVPHNIIGPRQKYDDPYRNVASIMMNMMLQKRPPIIYGDGLQQRCFSDIDDCVESLVKLGLQQNVVGQTINIGPDEGAVTIQQLYETIKEITNFQGEPMYVAGRPQEVKVALCSSEKARRMLGYRQKLTLRTSLARMCYWMINRGTKPFQYHLPLEIVTDKTPVTWAKKMF